MDNTELKNYVAQSRAKGVPDAEIANQLRATGWPQALVDEAVGVPATAAAPNYHPQTVSGLGAWVAFQYVLMFVSLAFAAGGVAGLLHHLVDAKISAMSPATNYYSLSYYSDYLVPYYISTCIVAFPIFAGLALRLRYLIETKPEVRKARIRRAAIYIALIWTFIAMMVRLIGTVYSFVKGNAMATNVLSHLAVTLVISGVIFVYFAFEIRKDMKA